MGRLSGGLSLVYRERLLSRYGPICYLCKERFPFETLTLEHLVPRGRGGSLKRFSNHALACEECQERKGSLTVEEFCKVYSLNPRQYLRLGVLKEGVQEPYPITNTVDLARMASLL
jgi:5-methylcytosine-specific restriction endonuclease McrA